MSAEQEAALIASLDQKGVDQEFIYDPSGKRDPFRPFDFAPKIIGFGAGVTELEKVDTSTLKLTAVIDTADGKIGMVESAQGQGYTLRKGTKVGLFGGEVIEITNEDAIILETVEEFTGEQTTREIKLPLREDEEAKGNEEE
jgi:type IV pilus assembly protein PilP